MNKEIERITGKITLDATGDQLEGKDKQNTNYN